MSADTEDAGGGPAAAWREPSDLLRAVAGAIAVSAERVTHQFQLRGLIGAVTYLALVAIGGFVLGVVTGVALVRRSGPGVRSSSPSGS